ncbi:MAG: hypothetical protein ABH826_04310 [Patescibacteria group bacterium]
MKTNVPTVIEATFENIVTGNAKTEIEMLGWVKMNDATRIFVDHKRTMIGLTTEGMPIPDGSKEILVLAQLDSAAMTLMAVGQTDFYKKYALFVNAFGIFMRAIIKNREKNDVATGAVAVETIATETIILQLENEEYPTTAWKLYPGYSVVYAFKDNNGNFAMLSFNGKLVINISQHRLIDAIKQGVDYILFARKSEQFSTKARLVRPIGNDAAMIWDKGMQIAITPEYERFAGPINGPLMQSLAVDNADTFNFAYRSPDDTIVVEKNVKLGKVLDPSSPLFAHIIKTISGLAIES